MSAETVRHIMDRAMAEPEFVSQLQSDPETALGPYTTDLTKDEEKWIRALTPEIIAALDVPPAPEPQPTPEPAPSPAPAPTLTPPPAPAPTTSPYARWLPSSFKEQGAAVLSLLLVILLFVAVISTLTNASKGGAVPNAFTNSKDLLNILLPFFSSVITFWLGVAIESRRADENANKADQEAVARAAAEQAKANAAVGNAETLARVEASLQTAQKAQAQAATRAAPAPSGAEEIDLSEIDFAEPAVDFDELLDLVHESQRAIRNA